MTAHRIALLALLCLGVVYSFMCGLVSYTIVGAGAHPIAAGFMGALVYMALQIAASVVARGEE